MIITIIRYFIGLTNRTLLLLILIQINVPMSQTLKTRLRVEHQFQREVGDSGGR